MGKERIELGKLGEKIALRYIKKRGYKIIKKNFSCPLGEIDIVARDRQTISFIEVKTRSSTAFGLPCEAILEGKRAKLTQIAWFYIKQQGLSLENYRFDVVSVLIKEGRRIDIDIIKDAF